MHHKLKRHDCAKNAQSRPIHHVVPLGRVLAIGFAVACMAPALLRSQEIDANRSQILQPENLVAWCIVPFDASKRGPAARAQMVMDLGLSRVAYDWRDVHVGSFEQEILEYKKRGIEFFAFWSWHPSMARLVEKHEIRPQFWLMMPDPEGTTQEQRVQNAVAHILPRVQQIAKLQCQVGIYNHGGWAGEPANMVAVCASLRSAGYDQVGIVYNFHHGHDHIRDFAVHLESMKPYLLCLNFNGMNDSGEPKILPIGKGQHEHAMIRSVLDSGYQGPIGILDHRPEIDAAESLRSNLNGLAKIRDALDRQ